MSSFFRKVLYDYNLDKDDAEIVTASLFGFLYAILAFISVMYVVIG